MLFLLKSWFIVTLLESNISYALTLLGLDALFMFTIPLYDLELEIILVPAFELEKPLLLVTDEGRLEEDEPINL